MCARHFSTIKSIIMKNLHICSLAIMLGFTSCQMNDDIANPAASESYINYEKLAKPTADVPSVYEGYCQAIRSEHYLIGKGSWENPDVVTTNRRATHYVLYASGIAHLDGKSGRTKLSLQYDRKTQSFSGILSSQFESARMDHTFSGNVINHFVTQNDIDPIIFGESKLVKGSMTTEYGEFSIREKVTLELSAVPTREHEINVKVTIDGVYCAQDIFVSRF